MNKYVKKLALTIPYVKGYHEEIERYRSEIDQLRSEIGRLSSKGVKYYSCMELERGDLCFIGSIDGCENCMSFCCIPHINFPHITLCKTPEESLMTYAKHRAEIMAENIRFSLLDKYAAYEDRKLTSECVKCLKFQLNNWGGGDGLIHTIILAMYPSPCQCKCVYCKVAHDSDMRQINTKSMESYEKVFETIDFAQKNNMTANDFMWCILCGETTIHPYRERIFNLVKDRTANFFTNCFIFDDKIAANLEANPQSSIRFSVDSGTPETWHKVKGVDNFNAVMENLEKYLASGARPEQIRLKYIILPGINDNLCDYRSIINIVKERLKTRYMYISADQNIKQRECFIKPAGHLLALLRRNNIEFHFEDNAILPDETERITAFADELLKSGEV